MPYGELADGRLWTQTEWVGDDVLLIAGLADDASSWHAQVGAATGRELAAAAPERVRSLILNGSWVRSDERFRSLIDSLIAAVERVGSLRALIEVISLWVYPPALREDGTVERWLDAVEDVAGAAFRSVRDGLWRRRKRSGRMTQVSYRAGSASRRCSPWGRRTACCRSSTHTRARGADPACDGHCVRGLRTPAVSGGPRSLQRTRARIPPPGPGGPRVDQRMTRTALVLQHQRNVPPALLSDWARQRGVELTVMRVDRAPTLPEPDAFAFAITLGSDHSAGHRKPAWVDRELEWLRLADRAALPVLGICFGAQALAVALGGSVEHARQPEIGWISVRSLRREIVEDGPWFAWHEDVFVLPPAATEIARNGFGRQAFLAGPHLGVQFHVTTPFGRAPTACACSTRSRRTPHPIPN